jgi:diadenosine tetraphosphatase ApaH/serine/threonine PP2A family protein phosphatase
MPITFEFTGRVKTLTSTSLTLERGRKYFINVGSVGQPRDGDPRAAYAIYDAKDRTVEVRRVEYDIETAQARIIEAGLPTWLAERLAIGK